jgi:hypothetical protein
VYAATWTWISPPSGTPTLSGFNKNVFSGRVTGANRADYLVQYLVDAYPASNPGGGALSTLGQAVGGGTYTYNFNSYWVMPGPHQVVAKVYDRLGNILVTSAPQPFNVGNPWPVLCSGSPPVLSVSTSTPVTSTWSTFVTITAQVTGPCATDKLTYFFWVDGIIAYNITVTNSGAQTATIDTTRYFDGQRAIAVSVQDSTNNTTYTSGIPPVQNGAAEWSRTVNFSNGAVSSGVWNNLHDFFLAPGATSTLGCNVINANQSPGTIVPCDYAVLTTAVATVDGGATSIGGSGVATVVNTLPAQGTNTQVLTMAETVNCTDLTTVLNQEWAVTSTCHTFRFSDTGRLFRIVGGTNWIQGLYQISSVDETANYATISLPGSTAVHNIATTYPATNGQFALGPTRTAWILAGGPATVPHFGNNNTILPTYDPLHSIIVHCGFSSSVLVGIESPLYTPGIGYDFSASGLNCLEAGMFNIDLDQYSASPSSQTLYQTQQTSFFNSWQSALTYQNFTKPIITWGTGDNAVRFGSYLFASTQTTVPPNWTISAVQYAFQQWANHMLAVSMSDEVTSSYGGYSLAGPVRLSSIPLTQGSIASITCVSGTYTVNGGANFSNPGGGFILQNATTLGLNTVYPTVFHNPFTSSACSGTGTYNASTDPNLILQNLWNDWYTSTNGEHYDAFASVRSQAVAAGAGRPFQSYPAAAGASCAEVANWNGNSVQSIGTVFTVADLNDIYSSHGNEMYLSSRITLNSVLNDPLGFGVTLRGLFGCYNTFNPTMMISQGTSTGLGFQGYPISIVSITNDIITFSSPHGVANIIPGLSRLIVTGSSNSAYNVYFYIIAAPTPTTLQVVLAQTDFTDTTASGGTLLFANGDTLTLCSNSIVPGGNKANGTGVAVQISPAGSDHVCYTGTASDTVNRHRGQTFTLSGVSGNAAWNSRTFNYGIENLIHATDTNGSASNFLFYREVPVGTSTGGTANIIATNTYVKGATGSTQLLDYNEQMLFGMITECAIMGCAGERVYKIQDEFSSYMPTAQYNNGAGGPKGGWLGQSIGIVTLFNDTTVANQLQANPHSENGRAVPFFQAASTGAQMVNRWQKYSLQTKLQAPDYGPLVSMGARSSAYGNILMMWNASDGNQTRTVNTTPYLESGQNFIISRATAYGIEPETVIAAGTTSYNITLTSGEAAFFVFPVNFAGEIPTSPIAISLADFPGATHWGVDWNYNPYYPPPIGNSYDCGSVGACQPPWDTNFGTIYYQIFGLDNNNAIVGSTGPLVR